MEDTATDKEDWESRLHTEVAYWRSIISGTNSHSEWVELFKKRAAGRYPWPVHLSPFLVPNGVTRILDVGSGPHTTIGPVGCPSPIKVTAVDPLAREYNQLLREEGVEPWVRTEYGLAESLPGHVSERFDLVHSRNAIDHSFDPIQAIISMLDCLTPEGTVYLEGAINEGVNQNYHGLHQWNFLPFDGSDAIVWNKQRATSIQTFLGPKYIVDAQRRGDEWYVISIKVCCQTNAN